MPEKFAARAAEIANRVTRDITPPSNQTAAASARRVLATLVVGALAALFLLGFGIYVTRERAAVTASTTAVDRWTELTAKIIGQATVHNQPFMEGVQSAKPVLDRLFNDQLIMNYRVTDAQGVVVASDKSGEVGYRLSKTTIAEAAQGIFYDADTDDLTDLPIPSGVVSGYRSIKTQDGQLVGFVGISANRRSFISTVYSSIWTGYICVVAVTLIFGGAGIEFLRRYLVGRHALQDRLVKTLVNLELAENVAHIGNWASDVNTGTVTWSREMFEIYGKDPATFIPSQQYHYDSTLPEERQRTYDELRKIIGGKGSGEIKTRIVRADGVIRDTIVTVRCQIGPDGKFERYFGITADVTEQMAAERALKERERELALAIAATEAVVWSWDISADIFLASPQLARVLGMDSASEKDLPSRHNELCHPDDREIVATTFRSHLIDGTPYDVEYRIRHANGRDIWFHSRGRVTEWEDSRPKRMVGTMVDITRRRVAEESLRQSQQTLGLALRAAEAGYYTYNFSDASIYWSPRFLEIVGLTDSSFPPTVKAFTDLVHPDDRAHMSAFHGTAGTLHTRESELRVKHADGSYIWLHIRAVTEFDRNQQPNRIIGFVQDVTARHKATEALAISEERFRLLAENATDIISVIEGSGTYTYTYVSPSVYPITGYKPEDFIGQIRTDLIFPEDRARFVGHFADIIAHPPLSGISQRYRLIRKDGSLAWMESRISVISDKNQRVQLLVASRDISEAVQAESAIRDSEARFRLLADNASDVILVADKNGIFRYASPSVERLLGYKPEEIVGQNAYTMISASHEPSENYRQLPANYAELPTAGTFRVRVRTKQGRMVWVETSVQKVPTPDGAFELHTATRDITDRVEYEAELRATRDRFQKQAGELASLAKNLEMERERAERANNAKSRFLAMMSHELRTPMTGILGMADLLLLSELTSEQNSVVRRLIRSAQILLDLLNDILDFSKIEAEQLQVDNAPFYISDITTDLNALFAPLASEKGVALSMMLPAKFQDAVVGDAKRFRQVLVNLVGNAIKFTEKGTVSVTFTQKEMPDGRVELRGDVTDSGIGITEEQLKRLFQPFVQGDVSTSRKYGGSGLGLAITRRLVEALGGKISVTSEPGKGSTFTFTILHQPDRHAAPRKPVSSHRPRHVPEALPTTGQGRRVLLAEDNETTRFLVETMLGKWGYEVDRAANGQQAVEAVAANTYDIVLMDIQMPIMDGSDAIEIIRAREKGAGGRLPIIALTADLIDSHQRSFLAIGADAIVAKPVNWEALMTEMNRLMKSQGSLAVAAPVDAASTADNVLNMATLSELRDVLGEATLGTMITRFFESSEQYRNDVEKNVRDNKLRDAKRSAHALKGLCAQFGADKMAALAKLIEEKAASVDEVADLLPQLARAATDTRSALETYVAKTAVPA